MKFTAKRLLAAGALGISAIVTPIALTVALPGVGSAPSSVAGASGFDQIFFNQTTGSPADTFQYQPAGGALSAPQAVNVSGNCATPTGKPPPAAILSVCGKVYSSTTYAVGSTIKMASLGTSGPATGVGAIPPSWSLDNKSGKGAEAIDFSPGADTAVIGSNRVFVDAQIPIVRKDSSQVGPMTVELAEFSSTDTSGTPLATQNCVTNGGEGAQFIADTNGNANCTPETGVPQDGFETVEVRDLTTSSSLSVGGPQASFELGNVICGGQSIQPTNNGGNVTATLTLTGAPTQCKSYTSFSSTFDTSTQLPTLSFNGFSASSVQLTLRIAWPAVPLCNPYVDVPGVTPGATTGIPVESGLAQNMCPVHSFSLDNTTFYDQAYCQTAQAGVPQQELCTVTKDYNNDVVNADGTVSPITTSTGAPGTQITEDWVGLVDMRLH